MQDIPVVLERFKGINLREPAGAIENDELAECVNFNVGKAGDLVKRTGFIEVHDGSVLSGRVDLLNHYHTDTVSQLLGVSDDKLYYSTGGSFWTLIGSFVNFEDSVQYVDKMYIIRNSHPIREWDGSTSTLLTGSPTGTCAFVFKDRLFIFNSKAPGTLNSRLYFSDIGDFTSWPSTNFIDIRPGDSEFLVGMSIINDVLVLYKSKSIWGLYVQGSPDNWSLRIINSELGCISRDTIHEVEGITYFVSHRGVYRTDGNQFDIISEPIESLFRSRTINLADLNQDFSVIWDEYYIISLRVGATSRRYLVFNIRTDGWTEWAFEDISPGRFVPVVKAASFYGVFAGSLDDGRVFRYGDDGFLDAGEPYEARFASKQYNFDMPVVMKRGKWVGLDAITLASVYVEYRMDGREKELLLFQENEEANWDGEVSWESPDYSWDGLRDVRRFLYKLEGPGYFRDWQLCVKASHPSKFIYYGATLIMSPQRNVIRSVT